LEPRTSTTMVTKLVCATFVVVALFCPGTSSVKGNSVASRVVIRENVSKAHRDELTTRLRTITGLSDLRFDSAGSLLLNDNQTSQGSLSARALLSKAVAGETLIVLEDASGRADVGFCRVVPGRLKRDNASQISVYVVLIDFKDFHQLTGDQEARAAFDVGWGLLHEIDHVVSESEDPKTTNVVGECEDHINTMRREVGLPLRANYFFTPSSLKADPNFGSRFVRLSFERKDQSSAQTKRYWLVWDSVTVGGLVAEGQRALVQ
jgi:hypothetical protein